MVKAKDARVHYMSKPTSQFTSSTSRRMRASALCFRQSSDNSIRWLLVRLRDPHSGTLYRLPPGGEIHQGESPAAAAEREVFEETGVRVAIVQPTELVVDYVFYWSGQNHAC